MSNPSPGRSIVVQTYDGWPIPNSIDADASEGYVQLALEGLGLLRPAKWLAPATGRYNCHGLVFAARRTNIPPAAAPNALRLNDLLTRDGFARVLGDAQVGDLAIYRQSDGDIAHSGIVSRIEPLGSVRQVFVWSKWGALGECEHLERSCLEASYAAIEYWRLAK